MAASDPIDNLIQQLEKLRPKLAAGNDQAARNEALQLSKKLTSSLGHPASTAVDLAFAVHFALCFYYNTMSMTDRATAIYHCFCENSYKSWPL